MNCQLHTTNKKLNPSTTTEIYMHLNPYQGNSRTKEDTRETYQWYIVFGVNEADCAAWAEFNLFDRRWHHSRRDFHTCAAGCGTTGWGTWLRVSGECGACRSCRGKSSRSEVRPSHTHSLCKKHRTRKRKLNDCLIHVCIISYSSQTWNIIITSFAVIFVTTYYFQSLCSYSWT